MTRPFAVDPAVMANIRPMQYHDAERVADMHQAAMGNSLWAKLGPTFLRELYRGLIENELFLGFVYQEQGQILGFIAGSIDASAMFEQVFASRKLPLAAAALPGIARKPAVLRHLVTTARYFGQSDGQGPQVPSESLFCSFVPELRGKRVSGHINKVLFDDLLARGQDRVKVTTEVDNKGANRQLQSWGFEETHRFRFYGKDMLTYVLDLRASPRVEPVSRHPTV